MNVFRLFYISVIKRSILYLKYFFLIFLSILGIRKFKDVINQFLKDKGTNRVSFHKTLLVNFLSLPFKQAKLIPIHIYANTQIISLNGNIVIKDSDIAFGMIKWGWFHTYRSQGKTRINNEGNIIFQGGGKIFSGCEIVVFKGGVLQVDNSFFIGENVLIYCQDSIHICENVTISYLSDISDSDFHYCIDIKENKVHRKCLPIEIGPYNWIANRTVIKKGTITPHHTIVASANAVLCKDYRSIFKPYSIIGGVPVKLIKGDVSRIWHEEMKNITKLDKLFNETDARDLIFTTEDLTTI